MTKRIGVLGAGSWGITLAALLSNKHNDVTLWEYDPDQAKKLADTRILSFFSYTTLPEKTIVTSSLIEACKDMDYIVFVLPSHVLRKTVQNIAKLDIDLCNTTIVSATKGIETDTLMRMSEVIDVELPEKSGQTVVLSGPTIAKEVAKKMPTAITAASLNIKAAEDVQKLFMTPVFRVYTHTDVIGVELGASLKNVLAIAAGICDGLKMGTNTKSALVTRGIRELVQLGVELGGKVQTFYGLSGLGDLMVTCFSPDSRNRRLGEKLGFGISLKDAEKEIIMIAEGVKTAKSAYKLGQKYKIELPIIEQIHQVLYYQKSPAHAISELMARSPKPEIKLEIGGTTI